ncbi:LysE family translocator [Oceanicella actignis]|uniref:Threonine/homoserine/homoserine lactone efflux protein n=1 Tax=Oceanicella actignis TaxID=1189325 RepID=A0A1M7SSV9_9RHOB|nr:LysE family transporter [Oceanicella actignis]SES69067.1 Threonine/homoserine/homoserine lactone efflux protein [Oceanicella actignis]SHN61470.1 Threonine/homoserine/homoserine lactone efflux protein [Oceanicella actignis]
MSADAQLAPLAAFVFAGLFSPGPNVVMLAASGARFGVRATVPHILGVAGGVGAIAAAAGLGVGAALAAAPWLAAGLKAIAALWILRLAWSMAAAARRPRGADAGRPMTLAEAALFQWVNPKVWAVALAAAAAGFAGGGGPAAEAARLALVFSGLNLLVCVFWTSAGGLLRRLMASERAHRRFMTALSALMAASAALIFV